MFAGYRRFLLLCPGIFFVLTASFAQTTNSTKKQPVYLLEIGLLFPNYRWELDIPAERTLKTAYGNAWPQVCQMSREENWPAGLRTYAQREENRDVFCSMRAYLEQTFSRDKVLLRVPASENTHLPPALRPDKDFFLIMRASGIALADSPDAFPTSITEQLEFLVMASLTRFASLADTAQESTHSLYGIQHPSRFVPEGAHHAWVEEALGGSRITYTAVFPPSRRLEEAGKKFEQLLQLVLTTQIPACPMVRSRETNSELSYYARFFPHNYAGDMDPRFNHLVLTIQVISQDTSLTGGYPTAWYPVLHLQYTH